MDSRRKALVGAALVLTAFLAACATAKPTESPVQSAVLRDTEWVLISLNGNSLIEGREITLKFAAAAVEGVAGCNTYGASYTASEDSLRLTGLYATEMACPEPEGILDQENAYLNALNAAARFRVDGERLEVYDASGAPTLVFVASTSNALGAQTPTVGQPVAAAATPTPTPVEVVVTRPTTTQPSPPLPTSTTEATPAAPSPTTAPPAGFKPYQDSVTGVSVYVPESWVVTGVVPGEFAIFQSYPEDKYVGGEALKQGDTKCDLSIRPLGIRFADFVQQMRTNAAITILSDEELILASGQTGIRMELESMGRSLSMITDANERVVVLTCFGEPAPFDEIAVTLGES